MFGLSQVSTPTISNVTITQQPYCPGDYGEMQIDVNNPPPVTIFKYIVGSYVAPGYFVSIVSSSLTTGTTFSFSFLNANIDYVVRLVDSTAYYNGNGGGSSGTSTVGIYDEYGPVTFTNQSSLSITSNITDASCFSACDGSIDLLPIGGFPNYTFTFNGANFPSGSFGALCAGTYAVTIEDGLGCVLLETYTISQPAQMSTTASVTNASCYTCNDGAIDLSVLGGMVPYSYAWSDGSINDDPTGLMPGIYDVSLIDAMSCQITNSYTVGYNTGSSVSSCLNGATDSLSLYNAGYFVGPGGPPVPPNCIGYLGYQPSKWIDVTGVDSIEVNTMQHRLYDNSSIYDQNNNLLWSWDGESVPAITWYFKKHIVDVSNNDSIRIEFYQGYGNPFCNGYLHVVNAFCPPNSSGCTDQLALNYDPTITIDDGSCFYCNDTSFTYISFCDSLIWNGDTYDSAGVYYETFTTNIMNNADTISSLSYCASHPNPDFASTLATNIENVVLIGDNNTINNNTSGQSDYYEDYTTIYADLTPGQSYTVDVIPGNLSTTPTYDPGSVNVYIDFNIDGDFNDIGEDLGVVTIPTGMYNPGSSYSFSFMVPNTYSYGATLMRVVCIDEFSNISACDAPLAGSFNTPWFGATEDYSIVLNNPLGNSCDSTVALVLSNAPAGCTDANALNYDPIAVCNDGSCNYNIDAGILTDCFGTLSNMQYYGDINQIQEYNNYGFLGLDSGIVLSTGHLSNLNGGYGTIVNSYTDNDLLTVANSVPPLIGQSFSVSSINDVAILEFDFQATTDTISFGFVFATDEYPTYVNTAYNDVFGLFLSGPGINGAFSNNAINLANIPNSTPELPITVSSVNTSINAGYFNVNANPSFTPNGYTVPIFVKYPVTPNANYHFKFALGDASDFALDSWIFLGDCAAVNATIDNGCTDNMAINYDPYATIDNGSCIYNAIYGCTDVTALNYNQNATIDDGSCNYCVEDTSYTYSTSCYGVWWNGNYYNTTGIYDTTFSTTINNGTISNLAYCQSNPSPDFINQGASIIESVQLIGNTSSIVNNTYQMPDHYDDYTSLMYADLTPGQSYVVNIDLGDLSTTQSYPSGAKVFIDYNIDGDFNDSGEEVGIIPYGTVGLTPIQFTVPVASSTGPTRMRVVSQYQTVQNPSLIGPCDAPAPGSFDEPWFGATEDYSIVLSGSCDSTAILNLTIFPSGCTDSLAINYDPNAVCDDQSCIAAIYGCTDSVALNYSPFANTDDGSCQYCDISLVSLVTASCFANDGEIVVQGNGIPNYYIWLELLDNGSWNYFSDTTTNNIASFNNLPADTFRVIMSDGQQCIDTLGGTMDNITQLLDSGNIVLNNTLYLSDDVNSAVLPIGFPFTFYGNTYSSCVISSNNYITFDLSKANQYSPWVINAPIPNPGFDPENSIMAPWQDINPAVGGSITYGIHGVAPNRVFIARWDGVPMFGCTSTLFSSYIYLYETTNAIETHVLDKSLCSTWNNGASIHGLINATSTNYTIVNDPILNQPRNYPLQWTAYNDAWQFNPSSSGTSYTVNQIPYGGGFTNVITTSPVYGCTDPTALNYDPLATCDDSSCIYMNIYGCTDPTALNYNSLANIDDGSCTYCDLTLDVFFTANTSYAGACDGLAYASASSSYQPVSYYYSNGTYLNSAIGLCAGTYTLTMTDGVGCQLDTTFTILNASNPIFGCTDSTACNFDSSATINNGNCTYPVTYTDVQTACGSYYWNGNTLVNSGVYTYTMSNSLGCDSILVLDLTIDNNTFNSTTISTCDDYFWQQNGVTYYNSGVYYDTIYLNSGCYIIETLNLFINSSTDSSIFISSCNNYYWPLTGAVYSSSGVYSDTSVNANGCTHIDNLHLTINSNSFITDVVTACDSFTWSNGVTYLTSGIDSLILQNINGCDSIAILDLTINSITSTNIDTTACDYYTWFSNGFTYSLDGIYTNISTNSNGCLQYDTLDLSFNSNTYATDYHFACDSFVWIDGTTYIAPNNAATYTISNSTGCDSIITLDLDISASNSSQAVESACDSYTWNGLQYFQSGVYDSVFTNMYGCDSTAVLDLTINSIPVALIIQNSGDLVVTAADSYFWSTSETSQIITPTSVGWYWCVITDFNGCLSDTAFYEVITTDINQIEGNILSLDIYPNPSRDVFNISFTSVQKQDLKVRIRNLIGEELISDDLQQFVGEYTKQINLEDKAKGIYLLEIETDAGIINKKLILQ
jgi:hypothetical protein